MLILCNHEPKVLSRWRNALSDAQSNIKQTQTLESLYIQLDQSSGAEIVLLPLQLPKLGGLQGIRNLRNDYPGAKLMIFSNRPEVNEGISLLQAGAYGYANTYMHARILAKAVELINLGEVWVGKDLMQYFIKGVNTTQIESPDELTNSVTNQLTAREKEVASLVAGGENNKNIARLLGVTERTVKAHMTSILSKTKLKDRLQLAIKINEIKSNAPNRQAS